MTINETTRSTPTALAERLAVDGMEEATSATLRVRRIKRHDDLRLRPPPDEARFSYLAATQGRADSMTLGRRGFVLCSESVGDVSADFLRDEFAQ